MYKLEERDEETDRVPGRRSYKQIISLFNFNCEKYCKEKYRELKEKVALIITVTEPRAIPDTLCTPAHLNLRARHHCCVPYADQETEEQRDEVDCPWLCC